ncbi:MULTISPECIES: aldehyde dehydrogenase [unclassified Mycolicibacterium]|uniref:aldehyde dehydrogenase family protein n=1 Tax=unclassified Mycolicibacterium TaxID=2636767 RepID=UPI0012DF00C0|nr:MULTISPECIES: aldehyde dehydrogenase family protein [unclassified Mycolicibacterium]MUL81915.1 aldehyde dehydrogenase family protein [Mycolicibacterium sp. CBMA 329]MUL87681.1 aldehyde dehydrogenase family protein [Mycolicibacterium sp. CBMA 331]MUL99456.1 aldehyde dehydrogenase family protein [Mycolicibacterium sp. CBMA 334]MUM27396.1 aldehyde dehydrogenase family protein [Mycolicibacterium sp. CBMA 295]MUM37978.1 aldehyde dehydrogenase family protein [Mycolicibacterium sp. CBMA 247]
MRSTQLLIADEWVPAADGATSETVDPATNTVIGTFAEATVADVNAAVSAARSGFESDAWQGMTPDQRGQLLWRIAELLERDAAEIAALETLDQGQPSFVSSGITLPLAAQVFRYYAGFATKIQGKVSPISIPGNMAYQRRVPLGVCALITPWNFPLAIAAWKLAPALATGNAVILKPAEQTPLSTVRLVEICRAAGVPSGVVNLLTGGPEVGKALVAHRGVDKVSFTGSTEVGQHIARTAADDFKRTTLELGGKAPSIVCADADIDAAVTGNLQGAVFNTGQACGAYTRFFVHSSRVDEFTSKLAAAADSLPIGPGQDPNTIVGPLVSQEHLDRVASFVETGRSQGAELVTGGARVDGDLANGFFYRPTVFAGVRDDMTIAREEIFGPVLSVMAYDDMDEVVTRANDTDYGLVAVLWTKDLVTAHTVPPRLRFGTVFVNQLPLIDPGTPWGGFGMSGWGRELGEYSIDGFTETQSTFLNLA